MVIRAAAQWPVELALAFLDRHIVNAGETTVHQAIRFEFPVLVTVGAEPVTGIIMPLVGVTHGDAVIGKRPELFDQTIIQLFFPLAGQETFRFFAVGGELNAVTPLGIQRIGVRDFSASRLFQPSSASRTFSMAVSRVKGGSDGRVWALDMIMTPVELGSKV